MRATATQTTTPTVGTVETAVAPTLAWANVCELSMLEPLWSEVALVQGQQVALVLLPDGRLYAVTNRDPATGSCVMSRGIVGSKGDRPTLASPLLKQVYDLQTGECFTNPAFSLQTFDVRIDSGIVQVRLDATRPASAAPPSE